MATKAASSVSTCPAVGTKVSIAGQHARYARASKSFSKAPPALVFTPIKPKLWCSGIYLIEKPDAG